MCVSTINIKDLAKEIVALTITDGVVNCDIVGWIDGNRLGGSIGTAVGIRTRDGVSENTGVTVSP